MSEGQHQLWGHLWKLGEVALLTLVPATLSAWRDILDNLDKPYIQRTPTGAVFHFKGRRQTHGLKCRMYRAIVVLSGAFVGGVLCGSFVVAIGLPSFEKFAYLIGGLGGWKLVDRWRKIAEVRFLEALGYTVLKRRDNDPK